MGHRATGLSLLILAVIASGCGGGSGGQIGGDAITVQGPQVQPNSIFEGSSTRVSMRAINTGEIESEVTVGENGGQIMTNYCPDFFSIEDFRSSSSTTDNTKESYSLEPDQKLRMNWELQQDSGNVPLNGYTCPLKFEVPFDYSVQAYRQLLIKERDAELDVKLPSKSSKGPLRIDIEVIGSSSERGSPVFVKGDQPEALIRIVNKRPEESSYTGLVEMKAQDLNLSASGVDLESGCVNNDVEGSISLYHGQSQVIRCNIEYDLGNSPSVKGEINAQADYTYVRSVGERTVEVKYSE